MEVCHFWSQLQALHRGTAVFVLLEFLPRVQKQSTDLSSSYVSLQFVCLFREPVGLEQ